VRIVELERAMIELSGLDPDRDIDIEIIGARGGEKLHEQLFNSYERSMPTLAEKILLAERAPLAVETVEAMFAEIGLLVLEGDAAGLAKRVSELSATRGEPEVAPPHSEDPRTSGDPAPPAIVSAAPEEPEPRAQAASGPVGPGGARDRRDAPAPLIHSRDS
jgi:hypothetical protein